MKKHGLLLFLAAFLLVAPVASAADFSTLGFLDRWFGRLVALFSGDEIGDLYPPSGFGSPTPRAADGDRSGIGSYSRPSG